MALLVLLAGILLASRADAAPRRLEFQVQACPEKPCPANLNADWVWFSADPRAAAGLEPDWQLLVDNVRFRQIEIRVRHTGGVFVLTRNQFDLGKNWAVGNNMRFTVPVAGKDIAAISIGFRSMDSPALMRSIKALSPDELRDYSEDWTTLVAVVIGIMFSAFTYNVFLLSWLHAPFQRWYVIWVGSASCYLMIWSGAILKWAPFMAGPASARTSLLLLGLMIVSGAAFFFTLVEKGKLPARLIDIGQAGGILVSITSVIAAFDSVFPARFTDVMLNLAIVVVMVTLAVSSVVAAFRGSRAVWYYIIGWFPVLGMLVLRIMRNFELLPQDDIVDQAGFLMMAWEALMLSLAIADRFRQLRKEADATDVERRTLLRVATTDPLTGLGNRALFQSLIERSPENMAGFDVIAVDIDFLKQTNDMAGHDAGDALIVAVAERLAAAAGPQATIARIGGDEFIIVLSGAARARVDAVRQMIALSAGAPMRHAGYNLTISMCAGHATDTDGAANLKSVHKLADLALYQAKAAGRGCWRSYDAGLADAVDARSRLVSEARTGMQHGEFRLFFQPIADANGVVAAFEAQLRWRHPQLGLLKPSDFADVTADSQLALALQQWVVEESLRMAVELRHEHPKAAVAVNFVTSQLQGPNAAVSILDQLNRLGLPPDSLIVEVTEAVAMGGLGIALFECLDCLRDAGVRVALDDFGTGRASLMQLRDVPCDFIKIDSSFSANLSGSDGARQVVQAIIDLAQSLGKRVIVQAVDTDVQLALVKTMAPDLGQGAAYGPAAELAQRTEAA